MLTVVSFAVLLAPLVVGSGNLETAYQLLKDATAKNDAVQLFVCRRTVKATVSAAPRTQSRLKILAAYRDGPTMPRNAARIISCAGG